MIYIPKYFEIYELVSPQAYEDRGEKAWELLDTRLLSTLDLLRKRYGPMIINDYFWGGTREWSGLRTPDSPFYSKYSQHSFGRAADILFKNYSADKIRGDLLDKYPHLEFHLITAIEMNVSWVHIDVRNTERIKQFYPKIK
jgi:hypothetical protein